MTTAEMVDRIRKYHASTEAVGPHEYDAQMLTIAARLEALDKIAARLSLTGDKTRTELTAATARAEKAEAEAAKWRGMYEKAWDECVWQRRTNEEVAQSRNGCWIYADPRLAPIDQLNTHDAARKEAGL